VVLAILFKLSIILSIHISIQECVPSVLKCIFLAVKYQSSGHDLSLSGAILDFAFPAQQESNSSAKVDKESR